MVARATAPGVTSSSSFSAASLSAGRRRGGRGRRARRERRWCRRARRCDIARHLSSLFCRRLSGSWSRAGGWRNRGSASRRTRRRRGLLRRLGSSGRLRRRWERLGRSGWFRRLWIFRSRSRSRRIFRRKFCARRGRRSNGRRGTTWARSRDRTGLAGSERIAWRLSFLTSSRQSQRSLRKICWSQSARSVPMTTELPSGEISSAVKSTELKNSSRVSLGLCLSAVVRATTRKHEDS